jgi:hypothetical protein
LPFGFVFDPEAQTRRELTVDGTRGDESLIMKVNPGTPYWFLIDKKTGKALGLKTDQ